MCRWSSGVRACAAACMGRGSARWTSHRRSPGCSASPPPSRSTVVRSPTCSHEPEAHGRAGPPGGRDSGLPADHRSAQTPRHRARGQPGWTDAHHSAAVREDRHRGVPDASAGSHVARRHGRGRGGHDVGDGVARWRRAHEDPGARRRREQPAHAAGRGAEARDDTAGAKEARLSVSAIRCTGLVKRYGDVSAVAGLDLAVTAGECFGLLGPNGAGKTTTIEILEGLTAPDAGDVEILGLHWTGGAETRALRERLGIQLQDTQLADKLTVEETVRLFRSFYQSSHTVDEVLALVGLEEKRGAWVGKLSGGQKQRLAVACALVSRPELLFLDEPTTGLDPQSRRQLWDVIGRFRAAGGTILLTTHYMEEAERLCDRVAIMDHGKIIALDTPRALIASLGAEHVVEFALADGATPTVEELAALPGVRAVRPAPDRTALTVAAVHRAVPALLVLLERRGAALSLLATHHATLEDVFVTLTGRQLRDA